MFDEYISHFIISQIILNRINSLKSHQIPLSMKSHEIRMTSHEIPMKSQEMSIYFHEVLRNHDLFPANLHGLLGFPNCDRCTKEVAVTSLDPETPASRIKIHVQAGATCLGLGLGLAMWGLELAEHEDFLKFFLVVIFGDWF